MSIAEHKQKEGAIPMTRSQRSNVCGPCELNFAAFVIHSGSEASWQVRPSTFRIIADRARRPWRAAAARFLAGVPWPIGVSLGEPADAGASDPACSNQQII